MAKKPKDMVPVSGSTLSQDQKKLSREEFYRHLNLDLDDYEEVQFTKEEAHRIKGHFSKLSTGAFAMAPMYCAPHCPIRERCTLFQMGKAPHGRACPLESGLIQTWTQRYMEEFDIDPANFTEVNYVTELAEADILLMRINTNLSRPENAMLLIDQVVGTDREGNPVYQKQLSPLLEQKDRLQKRKSQIIKLMVGDRQEQYKKQAALKQKTDKDVSTEQANLKKKILELQRQMGEAAGKLGPEGSTTDTGALLPQQIIDDDE